MIRFAVIAALAAALCGCIKNDGRQIVMRCAVGQDIYLINGRLHLAWGTYDTPIPIAQGVPLEGVCLRERTAP